MALVGIFNSYRYRDVLGRAGLDKARRFSLGARLPAQRLQPPRPAIAGGAPTPLPRARLRRFTAALPERIPQSAVRAEVQQIRSITRGEHARVQMALVRRGVRALRAAGVAVIVVEAPLHPEAGALYDTSIRTEFLDFAASLVNDYGVRFIPLEESGPFADSEFRDLTHVRGKGTVKLTRTILAAVRDVLDL